MRGVTDDGLSEGTVGLVDVFVARAQQHPTTAGVHLDGQLRHESALSHPGLAGDEHDEGVPGAGHLPLRAERFPFGGPTDEAGGVGEQLDGRGQWRHRGHRRHVVGGRRRRLLPAGQLTPISGTQLAQQRRDVGLDGALGDVQAGGDLGIGGVLTE